MKLRATKPSKKRMVLGELSPKNAPVDIVAPELREDEVDVPCEEKPDNTVNQEPKLRGNQIVPKS